MQPPERPANLPVPPEVRRHEAQVDRKTVRLHDARAPDPDGGPAWGVRTFRTVHGDRCVQVGRVVDDKLGFIGFDRVFHELPVLARISTCDIPQRPGPPIPDGARIVFEGLLPPVSTRVLDEQGFSRRFGCNAGVHRGPPADRSITPCDDNRFRFVAGGLVQDDVRALELRRVPATEPPRRVPVPSDGSFVYVLRGGDPAGGRVGAVDGQGRVLPIVRVSRGIRVPTGHPHRRALRITRPAVTPATGPAQATFALRWRVPMSARSRFGGWTYRIDGPGGPSCTVRLATAFHEPAGGRGKRPEVFEPDPSGSGRSRRVEGIRRGQTVTRRIKPPGPPPYRWCPGDYRGEIRWGDKQIVGKFGFRVEP